MVPVPAMAEPAGPSLAVEPTEPTLDDQEIRRRVSLLAPALASGVVAALLGTLLLPPAPRILWNASASVPPGLYTIEPGRSPGTGDFAVAWLPPRARAVAGARGYLPRAVPLIKPVAAVGGDEVCAHGNVIAVNARPVARRLHTDSSRRPLPRWEGCRTLRRGDLFLLAPSAAGSFDGRYFGVSARGEVIGRARPL